MLKILRRWNRINLIIRIAIGLALGIILAFTFPKASWISIFADLFVGALKSVAPVLVFLLVMSSVANSKANVGKKFRIVILLYILSTLIAAVVSVCLSFIFPVTIKLTGEIGNTPAPEGIGEIFGSIVNDLVSNPVLAVTNANYIGILVWAIVLGIALKNIAGKSTRLIFQDLSDAISLIVKWIINCAPFGIMGLVFGIVSENGLNIFADYGKLLMLLIGSMLFVVLIAEPLLAALFLRRNPYPLVFLCLRESGLTAFFTRSSAANIPVNMALCEKLGLDKDMYSVSLPLGATINMNGAAVTITIMTLAAANTLNIEVDIPSAMLLSILSTVAACGASGVTGGSLLLIPMACSLFGIGNDVAMQVVGVGFIIGVVQDSFETAVNSSGDVLFAATAEFYERRKLGNNKNIL